MNKNKNNNTNSDLDTRRQLRKTDSDNERDIGAAAVKGGQGARRKFSFLDALSPEERALFEEHAREDDDVPSCSGARLGERRVQPQQQQVPPRPPPKGVAGRTQVSLIGQGPVVVVRGKGEGAEEVGNDPFQKPVNPVDAMIHAGKVPL
uniref:Uncharacterized protein n=1 Tax=Bactrocera latifrons TaxID=174628 RepID=A0A0K8VZT1_BACLA